MPETEKELGISGGESGAGKAGSVAWLPPASPWAVPPFPTDDLLSGARPSRQQGQDTQASEQLLSLLPLLLFCGPQCPPLQTAKSQGLKAVAGSGVKGEVSLEARWQQAPEKPKAAPSPEGWQGGETVVVSCT